MKRLTVWRMRTKKKSLFAINVLLCGFFKALIQILPYSCLARSFGRSCGMLIASTVISSQQHQQALFLQQTIGLASRSTPWNSSCLTQALVAKFWCNHYGIPYFFFIGVDKNKSHNEERAVHAWVTAGAVAISGGHAFKTHHPIANYSNKIIY